MVILILFRALDFDCYSYTTLEPGTCTSGCSQIHGLLFLLANDRMDALILETISRSWVTCGQFLATGYATVYCQFGGLERSGRRYACSSSLIRIVTFNFQMSNMLMVSIFVTGTLCRTRSDPRVTVIQLTVEAVAFFTSLACLPERWPSATSKENKTGMFTFIITVQSILSTGIATDPVGELKGQLFVQQMNVHHSDGMLMSLW